MQDVDLKVANIAITLGESPHGHACTAVNRFL
jgi:hypothetical protein